MNHTIDTDYLFLATRVSALERSMLSHERIERMLEAATVEDAAKVLAECKYPELEHVTLSGIDQMLATTRQEVLEELYLYAPEKALIDVFRVKYDYHNAKVLLKSEALGTDANNLLLGLGRVPADDLAARVRSSELAGLPGSLSVSIAQARDTLGSTRNPQLADSLLDQACYNDMQTLARELESRFLQEYIRLNVDAINLKSMVRTLRMGKNADFLKGILLSGGSIDPERITGAVGAGTFSPDIYANSPLKEAAEAGVTASFGRQLTEFEKLCDDAIITFSKSARYTIIGEAPVVSYLTAKESELTTVRILLTGLLAGLPAQTIRERLREPYV